MICFEDILNNWRVDQTTSLIVHYKYLLLAMLVYQPPLRTSFYSTAKFIRSKLDNNKVDNFIWINKRDLMGMIEKRIIGNMEAKKDYYL